MKQKNFVSNFTKIHDYNNSTTCVSSKKPGIYRFTIPSFIGTGDTKKKSLHVIDYYIKNFDPDENGEINGQVIDYAGRLLNLRDRLEVSRLSKSKLICETPAEYAGLVSKLNILSVHIKAGNTHFEKEEYYSAEYEYDGALKIEPTNVEANLGKGKTLSKLNRYEEARVIFDELSNNPELYIEEHKHLFNDFGINLRKMQMYAKAIESYQRAIRVNAFDPHLYYNLAVVYTELKEIENAVRLLNSAIQLKRKLVKASFQEAECLLRSLKEKLQL